MRRTLVSGGINWAWYLCGDFNERDKTVHIYYHDRWHKYEYRGSNHPKHENIEYQILEDDKRIAYGVHVQGVDYLVTNPDNVFSYRDMSAYEPETVHN